MTLLEFVASKHKPGELPLDTIRRELTFDAMRACKGNQTHAAKRLGICVKTMHNWLKDLGLGPKDRWQ